MAGIGLGEGGEACTGDGVVVSVRCGPAGLCETSGTGKISCGLSGARTGSDSKFEYLRGHAFEVLV